MQGTMTNFIERSSNLMQEQISEWSEKFEELQARYDKLAYDHYALDVKCSEANSKNFM